MFVAVECLQTKVSVAAWHDKPSVAIVATEDRQLRPDLQRFMYQRSKSKVTELAGSHALYISRAEAVAKVIVEAARVGSVTAAARDLPAVRRLRSSMLARMDPLR